MPHTAGRCAWSVTAGILVGQSIPELTRLFGITADEWHDLDDAGRSELFHRRADEALAHARALHDPSRLNWIRVEWVWF